MGEAVDILVVGGEVLTQNAARERIIDGAVAIKGSKIRAVGSRQALQAQFDAKEVVDASGKAVLPGLVNAHTHAAMTLFRGIVDDIPLEPWLQKIWPLEKKYADAPNVALGSELAFAEMVRGGTTTAADMYWHYQAAAERAKKVGFRLFTGIGAIDVLDNESKDSLERRTREFLEEYQQDELIRPCVQVHATYTVSRETLLLVKRLAEEYGAVFVTHASETRVEVDDVTQKTGKTPIHYLEELDLLGRRTLLAHGVHLSDEEIRLLAERKVSIAHCPSSNLKLGSGIARVADLLAAGVNLAIGTDGSASNNDLDMLEEMHLTALVQKGITNDPTVLPAEQVLYMATMGGAIALNMDDEIGSLEAGKRADLILVGFEGLHATPVYDAVSHLVYATKSADVEAAMINGRWVMRGQTLLTMDEAQLKADVRRLCKEMIAGK
ncbi:MAG: amidohydrolase [Chloroflexi bacterium]|nr:amidohydrolase [Chloroflexota bacterium]